MSNAQQIGFTVFFLLCGALPAWAGPWLALAGETKALLGHKSETAPNRPLIANRRFEAATIDTKFTKLHFEHGLTASLTLLAIIETGTQDKSSEEDSHLHYRLGAIVNMEKLETGLLPPYMYRGLKKLFPQYDFRREKRASLRGAVMARHTKYNRRHDRNYGHETELALADVISVGRLSVMQNVETGETRMDGVDWRHNLYRFELGWAHRFAIGRETYFFDDANTGFAALTHLETLSWHWPERNLRVKLSHGDKRQSGFVKSDVAALEFEIRF